MKQILLKIKAFFLAILFLIASNTYAVTSHFCGSFVVDVSYLGKAESCGMEVSEDDCDSKTQIKSNCCTESTQLFDSDLSNFTKQFDAQFFDIAFVPSFVESYIELYSKKKNEYNFPKDKSPPYISKDFQVLFETFLI